MILRKPYAFIIKHFKKFHILLLVMSIYIFYKTTTLSSFVSEYLKYFSYDPEIESITTFVNPLFFFISVLLILIAGFLIYMLAFKDKPKLFYFLLIGNYLALIIVFIMVQGYFFDIANQAGSQTALAYSDLLFIFTLPQYPIMLMLIVRSIGLDLKRFGFQHDEEYLSIAEEDREEFELAVEFDKEKFKRNLKKKIREFKYVYLEYKFVVNLVITITTLAIATVTTIYIYNATLIYKQGDVINANNYEIVINESYLTSQSKTGELILNEDSNNTFLVINLTMKNNDSSRKINTEFIRLMNETEGYVTTSKYNYSFTDLGRTYDQKEVEQGESETFILIYEVKKDLDPERFVIYYQDAVSSQDVKIRKIALNVTDLTTVEIVDTKKLDETLDLELVKNNKESIIIDGYDLNQTTMYYIKGCKDDYCGTISESITAPSSFIYLHYSYLSDTITTEELKEYSLSTGRVEYTLENGDTVNYKIENIIEENYNGEHLYVQVPEDIIAATDISLVFALRNKEYKYILLGE